MMMIIGNQMKISLFNFTVLRSTMQDLKLSWKERILELESQSLMMINQDKSALLKPNKFKLLHQRKKLLSPFKEKTVVMVL